MYLVPNCAQLLPHHSINDFISLKGFCIILSCVFITELHSKDCITTVCKKSRNFQTRHVVVMEVKTSTWMIRTGFNKAKVRFVVENFAEVRRTSKVSITALDHSSQCTDVSFIYR